MTFSLQNVLCSDLVFLAEDILNCGYSKPNVSKMCYSIPLEITLSALRIQKA